MNDVYAAAVTGEGGIGLSYTTTTMYTGTKRITPEVKPCT